MIIITTIEELFEKLSREDLLKDKIERTDNGIKITLCDDCVVEVVLNSQFDVYVNNSHYGEIEEQDIWGLILEFADDGYVLMDERITVWPKSSLSVAMWAVVLIFPTCLLIVSFLILFEENDTAGFAISVLFTLIIGFFLVRSMLFRVSFIDRRILSPKKYGQERLDIGCDQLLTCEFGFEETLRMFLYFKCLDGKEKKIVVTLFSVDQLRNIIELIKERGGLKEQRTEDIIDDAMNKRQAFSARDKAVIDSLPCWDDKDAEYTAKVFRLFLSPDARLAGTGQVGEDSKLLNADGIEFSKKNEIRTRSGKKTRYGIEIAFSAELLTGVLKNAMDEDVTLHIIPAEGEAAAELLFNDNGHTILRFSKKAFDIREMKGKIDKVLTETPER